MNASGWAWNELPTAMRGMGLSHVATATMIRNWAYGSGPLSNDQRACVMRFIDQHPKPGPAADFMAGIAERARIAAANKAEELQRRRDAVAEQRAKWRRDNLAREHQPKVIQRGPLYGLDRDTVRALRGY